MKKVVFIRHSKSEQDINAKDIHRPLAERGIERAEEYSKKLKDVMSLDGFQWFSSPATRAMQTAEIYKNQFPNVKEITEVEKLYTFQFGELKNTLDKLWSQHDAIVVFGHNPAFTEAVNAYGDKLILELSTCGTVYIEGEELDKDVKGKTKLVISKDLDFNAL